MDAQTTALPDAGRSLNPKCRMVSCQGVRTLKRDIQMPTSGFFSQLPPNQAAKNSPGATSVRVDACCENVALFSSCDRSDLTTGDGYGATLR